MENEWMENGLSGCGCGKWKVDVDCGKWRGSGSHTYQKYVRHSDKPIITTYNWHGDMRLPVGD